LLLIYSGIINVPLNQVPVRDAASFLYIHISFTALSVLISTFAIIFVLRYAKGIVRISFVVAAVVAAAVVVFVVVFVVVVGIIIAVALVAVVVIVVVVSV
jgi:hypothetical protein